MNICYREGPWLRDSNIEKLLFPGEEEEQRRQNRGQAWVRQERLFANVEDVCEHLMESMLQTGPRLRGACKQERRGWMLTWA